MTQLAGAMDRMQLQQQQQQQQPQHVQMDPDPDMVDTWSSQLEVDFPPPVEQATGGSGALGDFSMFGGMSPQYSGMLGGDPVLQQQQQLGQQAGSNFMSNIFDLNTQVGLGDGQ